MYIWNRRPGKVFFIVLLVSALILGGLYSTWWYVLPMNKQGFIRKPAAAPKQTQTLAPVPQQVHLSLLEPTTATWQLPTALGRPVVVNNNGLITVAGGLTNSGSTDKVFTINPENGSVATVAPLAEIIHDAAGALINGTVTVFGGGDATPTADVQQPGTVIAKLPSARADVSAVTIKNTTYLIGGYAGTVYPTAILSTNDGKTFQTKTNLAQGVRYAAVASRGNSLYIFGGELANGKSSADIISLDIASGQLKTIGQLPQALSHAAAFTIDDQLFVVGGTDGTTASSGIFRVDPFNGKVTTAGKLPYAIYDAAAVVIGKNGYLVGGRGNDNLLNSIIMLAPKAEADATAPSTNVGYLVPGSDPAALLAPVLIVDRDNDRLIEVNPEGQIIWEFPQPGDLSPGQVFKVPDDAFFTPDGKQIISTQEDNYMVSLIDIATRKIVWSYGHSGVPGSKPDYLNNPDDAIVTPNGDTVIADIKNCRIIVIRKDAHTVDHSYGKSGDCKHNPPNSFGHPNGVFPMQNGNWLATEINGSWVSEMAPGGKVIWSAHPPKIHYPSDTNEISPDRYLTVDYSFPGAAVIFNKAGQLLWQYVAEKGQPSLNYPSLALPLPNGNIILNDDRNHRVIVIDVKTNKIVWQYGATGKSGKTAGYLNNPDGLDIAPPYSVVGTKSQNLQAP
ncbi:MAG: hypothetical protein NVS1B7_4900 [Candidatus Saccharimonadales bacterium]